MKNKILISLLAFSTLFSNVISPAIAREIVLDNNKNKVLISQPKSRKALSGGVSTNQMPESIEFKAPVAYNYNVYRHTEGNNDYYLLMPKLPDLGYKDSPIVVKFDNGRRFSDCMTFLMLGGLSVSGSVEKSFGESEVDYRFFRNFKKPMTSLKEGWKADDNAFWINYIGHPGEFFLMANYLKTTGASDLETLLFAEIANFTWEFVCEGTYVPPSPKDLITDSLGAIAGIYFYNKIGKNHFPQAVDRIRAFGREHKIEFHPSVKYNDRTRGVAIGARVTKKI